MEINLVPDSSVSSAPTGFTAAVQAAATILDQDFPGNYTVNITYGWGTYDNVTNRTALAQTISERLRRRQGVARPRRALWSPSSYQRL